MVFFFIILTKNIINALFEHYIIYILYNYYGNSISNSNRDQTTNFMDKLLPAAVMNTCLELRLTVGLRSRICSYYLIASFLLHH